MIQNLETCAARLFAVRYLLIAFGLLFSISSLCAATYDLGDVTVSDDETVSVRIGLPAGAEFIRVSGDWEGSAGSPNSDQFELKEVVAPGQITGGIEVFPNAIQSPSDVAGLSGIAELSSTGGAGMYTFVFQNNAAGTEMRYTDVSIELLTSQEFISSTPGSALDGNSPTFPRPSYIDSNIGATRRYSAQVFTPSFSGDYVIESNQSFDGVIALYFGSQPTDPFSNFLLANDDSAEGASFSRIEISLTAGQPYTLVTTSFDSVANGAFTNTIQFYSALALSEVGYAAYATERGFVQGPTVDESGNGLSNLIEYAVGREADSPLSPPLETFIRNGRAVGRFYRDSELFDITYVLQVSDDLVGWTDIYDSSVNLMANVDGDFQEIEDVQIYEDRRFLRLRVILAE